MAKPENTPPEWAYSERSKAQEEADNAAEKSRVKKKKIDGKQYWVVEKRMDTDTSGPADLELYIDGDA